jgi:D-serine deaminase-like pyridoxal phosphate-dependent protein
LNESERSNSVLTTLVGQPVEQLDTPALLVDLEGLTHNITTMAADIAARGARWRPHTKASKNPAIAHQQLAAGAIGVTVAKVSEAEVMAAAGIRDILIANEIVGPIKTRRLAALARHADVIVAVDNPANVAELEAAAAAAGSRPRVVIEVNTGMNRCGVEPDAVVALAQRVAAAEHLRFVGVMAWEGHAMRVADATEREAVIRQAVGLLTGAADACRAAGLPVDIVSAGGTGTYLVTAGIPGVTEVQAGGGIFGDASYLEMGANVEPALTLMTQVTSRPAPDRVIVDSGRKTVDPGKMPPIPCGLTLAKPPAFSAEHGVLTLAEPSDCPRIGERVNFRIGYSDQIMHLHDYLFGVRNGVVETIWPIAGRGRLQ